MSSRFVYFIVPILMMSVSANRVEDLICKQPTCIIKVDGQSRSGRICNRSLESCPKCMSRNIIRGKYFCEEPKEDGSCGWRKVLCPDQPFETITTPQEPALAPASGPAGTAPPPPPTPTPTPTPTQAANKSKHVTKASVPKLSPGVIVDDGPISAQARVESSNPVSTPNFEGNPKSVATESGPEVQSASGMKAQGKTSSPFNEPSKGNSGGAIIGVSIAALVVVAIGIAYGVNKISSRNMEDDEDDDDFIHYNKAIEANTTSAPTLTNMQSYESEDTEIAEDIANYFDKVEDHDEHAQNQSFQL